MQGGNGMIAFASSFPGSIKVFEIGPGQEYIFQKRSFLASEEGVELSLHFQKRFSSGLFGGEGLFNTVVKGPGHVWLQTMPASSMAASLLPYLPTGK